MTTLRALPKTQLSGNATLSALLTGGIKDAQNLPRDGGGMSSAPKVAGTPRIQPHAVIRWRADRPFGPETVQSENTSFEVYLYDHAGYVNIETAVGLIKALLHRQRFQADDRQLVYINWVFTSGELTAEEYAGAPCRFMRFEVTAVR